MLLGQWYRIHYRDGYEVKQLLRSRVCRTYKLYHFVYSNILITFIAEQNFPDLVYVN